MVHDQYKKNYSQAVKHFSPRMEYQDRSLKSRTYFIINFKKYHGHLHNLYKEAHALLEVSTIGFKGGGCTWWSGNLFYSNVANVFLVTLLNNMALVSVPMHWWFFIKWPSIVPSVFTALYNHNIQKNNLLIQV